MADTKKIPYCPLSMSNPSGIQICQQENCAWWVNSTNTCAIYVIGHKNVLEIKEKQGN